MKTKRRILSVIMTVLMCLSISICSISSVSAAETTKSNSSSDTDSDNNGDTADSSDSVDDTSDDNDNSQTSYDWSKNTTGNANLAADQTVVMENGTYQLIAVTTRDDDMFYVIIDKTKKENNVYFLNEVDTADLDKLANDDSNVSNGDSSTETTAPLPMKMQIPKQPHRTTTAPRIQTIHLCCISFSE